MDTFNFKKQQKNQEDDARRKEEGEGRRKWKLKHRQC
jgi:hypothetical protein